MIEWANNWVKGINYRRDFQQDVGGWFTQVGSLYVVYHLWGKHVRTPPLLPPCVHSIQVHGRA